MYSRVSINVCAYCVCVMKWVFVCVCWRVSMRECVGGIDSAKSKQKYQGSLLNGAGLPQAEVEQSLVTHLLFMDYPPFHDSN